MLFRSLRQISAVTWFGLATLPQRKGASLATIVGIAGVVAVLVGALATARGFVKAMSSSVTPEGVIIMRSGADSEMTSGLSAESVKLVLDAPGIASGPQGVIASPELFVVINLPLLATGTDANVPLRGVSANAGQVRGQFEIVKGRMFQPGTSEIVVGVGAESRYAGLQLGSQLRVGADTWKVVGLFSAGGGLAESEIWSDAAVLQGAYRRGNSYQSIHLRLTSPDQFTAFKDTLTKDPRLNLKIVRESEYYAEQSRLLSTLIKSIGFLITALMAVGALFGALNTMFSAVSTRTREIATLRALGFRRTPVICSVLLESMALAVMGGAIGGVFMYLLMDGYRTGTMNWQSFSQVTFALDVTPELILSGLVAASVLGLLGGLMPALRAANLPISNALREN